MSIPVKEYGAELPPLGTAEAAVQSCVSLIAGMSGQPERTMAYWLDLYYQVRGAYERESGDETPVFIRAEDLLPALRTLWKEVLGGTDVESKEQTAQEDAPAPAAEAEGKTAGSAEAGEGDGAERSAPPRDPPGELTGFVPVELKKQGGQPGNTSAADAAAFKREVLERLRQMRKDGLTIGKIVDVSNGAVTEHTVMDILDAKRVPIAVYRLLAAVLDKIES